MMSQSKFWKFETLLLQILKMINFESDHMVTFILIIQYLHQHLIVNLRAEALKTNEDTFLDESKTHYDRDADSMVRL